VYRKTNTVYVGPSSAICILDYQKLIKLNTNLKNDVLRAIKSEDTEARAYGQTTNRNQPRINVLKRFLKTVKLQASRMSTGRLFQVLGTEMRKAR